MADRVVAEDKIVVGAADHDAHPRELAALPSPIVQDRVLLEEVAVGAHRFALGTEQHAGLAVAGDRVVAELVVGILVADGDAGAPVPADLVLLEQPVLYSPADIEPVAIVVERAVAAQDRRLRAAARVQPEARVVLRETLLDRHMVRDLKADAVAVVI